MSRREASPSGLPDWGAGIQEVINKNGRFFVETCGIGMKLYYCLLLFTREIYHLENSTKEFVRNFQQKTQNKPNFSQFFTQKQRFHQKTNPIQSQSKPDTKPNKPNNEP
jgi:hypothetical protein